MKTKRLTARLLVSLMLAFALVSAFGVATAFAEEIDTNWGSDYDNATEFTISSEPELRAFAAMVNEGKDFAGRTVNPLFTMRQVCLVASVVW